LNPKETLGSRLGLQRSIPVPARTDHGIGPLSRDWQSVRLSHRGRPPIVNSCCELERATISAKVLNAEFPPGVDRDGVGRDYPRKHAEDHGLKTQLRGGRSDTIAFERKSAQRLCDDHLSIVDRVLNGESAPRPPGI
jgi:hypothetical protein